jgi:hypothetical protein
MSETLSQPHDTIPTIAWTSPERREQLEAYVGTPLGSHGYEFNGSDQYKRLLSVDTLAEGVITEMGKEFSDNPSFRVFRHANFDNPGGTFSSGYLLFGASSREIAERYQPDFVQRVNFTLEGLESGFRLDEQSR